MEGQLVLLTGATGMIGFKIMIQLLEAGYSVRAAVRDPAVFNKLCRLPAVSCHVSQLSLVIVRDITEPGAYDDAVRGVQYIIHVASPLMGNTAVVDPEISLIQPAVRGSIGILESASREPGILRVVMTGSVLSIATVDYISKGNLTNEATKCSIDQPPFSNDFTAYGASKSSAYNAVKRFMEREKPSFDVINILPVFVLGRDDTVTDVSQITKGTNGLLMGPVLGFAPKNPLLGFSVHVDDVATLHVRALDRNVEGNQDFLAASSSSGITWADSFDIIRRQYPKQCADGLFKLGSDSPPATIPVHVDNMKGRQLLGAPFKSFNDQVLSVIDHYLELLEGNKKASLA